MPSDPKISARQRDPAGRCQHHADDGGEHDQQAHFGLGELQIIAPSDGRADGSDGRVSGDAGHRARVPCRSPDSGQSSRSNVTIQTPATPLRRCAKSPAAKGIPKCTMVIPMPICSSTAPISSPPASLQCAGSRAREASGAEKHQDRAGKQRADPMRHMNGDARGIREHAAGVVDVQSAPQHEGVAKIHVRPPRLLAGREIRAGHRCIIGAGPAAEGNLQQQRGEAPTRANLRNRQFARRQLPPLRASSDSHHRIAKVVRPPSK